MPQLINHIDAIARAKGRDVLFLEFHPKVKDDFTWTVPDDYDWKTDAVRTLIVDWLTQSRIHWVECGPVANPNVMRPYYGQIYLDVPFDETVANTASSVIFSNSKTARFAIPACAS